VTIIKEKKSTFSSLKIKAIATLILLVAIFYCLCFNFTTTKELAEKRQKELLLVATNKEITKDTKPSPIDASFLKDLNTRWAELNTKLEKERSAMFFITKSELADFLNFNPFLKDWQKNKIFQIEEQSIKTDVFLPVQEIPILKYFPGINNRTIHLKVNIMPIKTNTTTRITVSSLALPNWSSPLKAINISWPLSPPNETWKYFNAMLITDFGVFLKFERKTE
jgi:hypothetical protein